MNHKVSIRLVETNDEFAACEGLSRSIWGAQDRNVVPRELLLTIQQYGGVVLGAFLPDRTMVGFVFGFLGMRNGQLRLCSHQLGVLPAYRGTEIGVRLKRAQGEEAARRGLELITWTFDPLEAKNAYINLHRLGAIARVYHRDHYGVMDDELNRGLPTDRFLAEWWVRKAVAPDRPAPDDPVVMLRPGTRGEPVRGSFDLADARVVMVGIPPDFQEVKRRSMELAREWRLASRAAFETAIDAGFLACDFLREGWYVMEPGEPAASATEPST